MFMNCYFAPICLGCAVSTLVSQICPVDVLCTVYVHLMNFLTNSDVVQLTSIAMCAFRYTTAPKEEISS